MAAKDATLTEDIELLKDIAHRIDGECLKTTDAWERRQLERAFELASDAADLLRKVRTIRTRK